MREWGGAGGSAGVRRWENPRSYRSALAIAEELGMEPLRAHCHLGLGRLERRACRPAEAERHHGIARQLLEAMAMTRWLDGPQGEAS